MFRRSDKGIYYLHTYYPTRYQEHSGVSELILDFKRGDRKAIEIFQNELVMAFRNEVKNKKNRYPEKFLVLVPSHSKNEWSYSLQLLASEICKRLSINDYSRAIRRITDHEKLAWGGDRSVQSHLNTMRIEPDYEVNGKEVIILDDVTTTGGSLIACSKLLKRAGAQKCASVAIGKTYK